MNIAVFGGSFNPIHLGHIKLITTIKEQCDIDKVILVPTGITPHKSNAEMVSSEHRYNMCKLAVNGLDFVEVSDIEIKRQGKSFTYITLNSLKELYSKDKLHLIVGADMFLTLESWRNPQEIFNVASIITVPRDDADYNVLKNYAEYLQTLGAECFVLKNSVMDVSSSLVRSEIKNNNSVTNYVCNDVMNYITDNNLYRA